MVGGGVGLGVGLGGGVGGGLAPGASTMALASVDISIPVTVAIPPETVALTIVASRLTRFRTYEPPTFVSVVGNETLTVLCGKLATPFTYNAAAGGAPPYQIPHTVWVGLWSTYPCGVPSVVSAPVMVGLPAGTAPTK